MGESLADKGDGEELIDTKIGVYIRRTKTYGPLKYASSIGMGISLMAMQWNSNSWTDRCTHMGQSLADRGDGEELIDTKVGSVYTKNKDLQPSKVCF